MITVREPFLVQRHASRGVDRRPLQWQADVGEICAAYRTGGEAGDLRTADAFARQAKESHELADQIEGRK